MSKGGILQNMDGLATMETEENTDENVPCVCSMRWLMGYMGILLGVFLYLLRVDFSMAMVCMVIQQGGKQLNNSNETLLLRMSVNDTDFSTVEAVEHATRETTKDIQCKDKSLESGTENKRGEFVWSKSFQSILLSIYYVGCFVNQIPGGWVANRYGGRRIISITMLISAVGTLVTPVLLRANPYIVLPIRFIMGVCSGPVIPAWFDLVGLWAPPFERSRMIALFVIGQVLGAVLAYSTSGLLCAYAPDNGWPYIFYMHGASALLFVIAWHLLTADQPNKHRRISQAELSYIAKFVANRTKEDSRDIPWRAILTSRPVWAIYICHICDAWMFFTLLTCLPMFLKDVLKLDIEKNGLYSSLPWVLFAIGAFASGFTADFFLSKRVLTITLARRLFQVVGFLGSGVAICLSGFVTCSQETLAIMYISLCNFFLGSAEGAGFSANIVDIAPKYAGVIFSISNTMAQVPGFVAPVVVGTMTPNGSGEEWRTVFYICAGLNVLGIIVFGTMSTGTIQAWSRTNIALMITTKTETNINDCIPDTQQGLDNSPVEHKNLLSTLDMHTE